MTERGAEAMGGVERNGVPIALVFDNDLFFAVHIRDTLVRAGISAQIARTVDAFRVALRANSCLIAFVNLASRGLDWQAGIADARDAGVPVIAYGPHVDVTLQSAARAAGATRVIANSKLAGNLPALVERVMHHAEAHNSAEDAAEDILGAARFDDADDDDA